MQCESRLARLSDDDLLRRLTSLVGDSRRVESDLVAHIGEVDGRRLYAREASPSMFAYCTEVLHLSEAEAYLRIAAARAARDYPVILDMLGDGRLHLSGIARLTPHLSTETAAALLARAAHRSKRQIEELVAEIAPRPDVPTIVRKLPTKAAPSSAAKLALSAALASAPNDVLESPSESPSESAPLRGLRPDGVRSTVTSPPAPQVEPLAPARYKVQFTASAELKDKLERLQELMRSQVPSGDLAEVIENLVRRSWSDWSGSVSP